MAKKTFKVERIILPAGTKPSAIGRRNMVVKDTGVLKRARSGYVLHDSGRKILFDKSSEARKYADLRRNGYTKYQASDMTSGIPVSYLIIPSLKKKPQSQRTYKPNYKKLT